MGLPVLGSGPSTASGSMVSNTDLSEFVALIELWGESSVSSSQRLVCTSKRTHRVLRRTHRVCRKT